MHFIKGVFLAIFIFISSLAIAAEDQILSIKEVLDVAYQDNPQMIEARKAIDFSKGDLINARSLANPEIEVEIGGFKKNEEGKRRTNLDTIALKQSFDPPGVYLLRRQMALNDVKIGEEALKSVWVDVYVKVLQAYWKIILDKKDLELADGNLKTLRQFFSNVQIRFQSGRALKNDLQRAKIELLKAENNYLVVDKTIKIDKGKLNLLLNRSMEDSFDIKEELKEEDLKFNLKELTDLAFSKRPDLKIEQLRLDSKNKALMKEELNRLPSFSVGVQKTDMEDDKDYSLLASVSIPFWNFNQGEIKKAKAEKETQKIRLDASRKKLSFEVYEAYLNAELAKQQMNLLKKSLEEANELIRLADLRYREGEIDFINYMDQVRASTETRVRYYEGLFNLNQSISELERSVNTSLQEGGFLK